MRGVKTTPRGRCTPRGAKFFLKRRALGGVAIAKQEYRGRRMRTPSCAVRRPFLSLHRLRTKSHQESPVFDTGNFCTGSHEEKPVFARGISVPTNAESADIAVEAREPECAVCIYDLNQVHRPTIVCSPLTDRRCLNRTQWLMLAGSCLRSGERHYAHHGRTYGPRIPAGHVELRRECQRDSVPLGSP